MKMSLIKLVLLQILRINSLRLEQSKEDLVDAISSAAKKLIEDPNSYYNNLRKSFSEVQANFMPNNTKFLGCERFSNEKILRHS